MPLPFLNYVSIINYYQLPRMLEEIRLFVFFFNQITWESIKARPGGTPKLEKQGGHILGISTIPKYFIVKFLGQYQRESFGCVFFVLVNFEKSPIDPSVDIFLNWLLIYSWKNGPNSSHFGHKTWCMNAICSNPESKPLSVFNYSINIRQMGHTNPIRSSPTNYPTEKRTNNQ